MFTRYFSSNRKILILSIITGLIAALLLGSLQFFFWSYHKREVKFDTLIHDVSIYMESYFDELKNSIDVAPAAHVKQLPRRQSGTYLARCL